VVGYDPASAFYDDQPPKITFYAPLFGAKYTDAQGHSILAKEPGWARYFRWQKGLIDYYGWDKLQRFQSGLGQEFSASNAFETGQLAMMIDGEWRVAFIENEHPNLSYATAPMPVDDAHPELYGRDTSTARSSASEGREAQGRGVGARQVPRDEHAFPRAVLERHPQRALDDRLFEVARDQAGQALLDVPEDLREQALGDDSDHRGRSRLPGPDPELRRQVAGGDVKDLVGGLKNLDKQIDDQLAQAKKGGKP
jgi:multiple sugar transport system substrate-binding protein